MKKRTSKNDEVLRIGMSQISPIWLQKDKTTKKVIGEIEKAGEQGCDIVAFGECIIPGYPFWIENTDGARFNSTIQKKLYSHYLKESVDVNNGDLDGICQTAKNNKIAVYLGVLEKASDRGGKSVFCSLVYISKEGKIESVHRKLMPTYEERLVWSIGDGNGLVVHKLGPFTLGGLNCWENWIPLARMSLYGQGEDLHFAVWPGSDRNTSDITKFIALESRSFVVSVSGILKKSDIDTDAIPYGKTIKESIKGEFLANGGSCIASPDGKWVVAPSINTGTEKLIVCDVDHSQGIIQDQMFYAVQSTGRDKMYSLSNDEHVKNM